MQGTDITRTDGTEGNQGVARMAPMATIAKVRKGNVAPVRTPAAKVAPYKVQTEHVAAALVAAAKAGWAAGKRGTSLAAHIAGANPGKGCTSGQATFYAMLAGCPAYKGNVVPGGLRTYGTDAKGAPKTPAALALAIAAMRNQGHSWVAPRVAFGITEAGCRAAYGAATGTDPASTGVGGWASSRTDPRTLAAGK